MLALDARLSLDSEAFTPELSSTALLKWLGYHFRFAIVVAVTAHLNSDALIKVI